jgi:uncharacterized protein (DUF305 family)
MLFLVRGPLALSVLGLVLGLAPACRSHGAAAPIVQPGAPGAETRVIGADKAADLSRVGYTEADVRFMQGMIGHHSQAVEMVALVPSRTSSEDMKRLALRIDLSQADEIAMMKRWLTDRGQKLPDPHAHHHPGGMMPGMLTAEEMARLAAASGPEFDRLFLTGMIKHHEGALTMVQDLYGAGGGAGQESDIYAFAADVDADQRMEIDRMRGMLGARRGESAGTTRP